MCDLCNQRFEFTAYGSSVVDARRNTADIAHFLQPTEVTVLRRRGIDTGDLDAAADEAFLMKWLATSGARWPAPSSTDTGYVAAMTRAAKLGLVDAMVDLGVYGPEHDRGTWLDAAARKGSTHAMDRLGVRARQAGDLVESAEWFHRAAEAGCSIGAMKYGLTQLDRFRKGQLNVHDARGPLGDEVKRCLWLATENGDAEAPVTLRDWYVNVDDLDPGDAEVRRLEDLGRERGASAYRDGQAGPGAVGGH